MEVKSVWNKLSITLISVFFFVFLLLAVMMPPMWMGEADDYTIATITLLEHGSMDVRESDIIRAEKDYPDFAQYIRMNWDNAGGSGFLKNDEGVIFTWYSGVYSAACIPMKVLLDFLNLNQCYAFAISNVIFYVIALLGVLFFWKQSDESKFWMIVLLCCNPAIAGYFRWPSAELFIFMCVVLSLVFFTNRHYCLAALFCALAGTQNSTIMFFGFVIIADYFIHAYINSQETTFILFAKELLKNHWKYILRFAICFTPCFLPFALNYYFAGAFNLQVQAGFTQVGHYGIEGILYRALAYLFDFNFGILPYFPIILCLFFLGTVYAIKTKNKLMVELSFGFFGVLGCFSMMGHINCGMTGISRYNAWVTPFILFFVIILFDKVLASTNITNFAKRTVLIFSASITFVVTVSGLGTDYTDFTPLTKEVLKHSPSIYTPYPYTFVSRTNHIDGGYTTELPSIFTDEYGYVHKILVTEETEQYLRDSILGNQKDTEKFGELLAMLDNKKIFNYVNIPLDMKLKVYNLAKCSLGTNISFQQENNLFSNGISSCEGWGTWLSAKEATIAVEFTNYVDGDIQVSIELAAVFNGKQHIEIFADEISIYSCDATAETNTIDFTIPVELVNGIGRVNLIIKLNDAISPKMLGWNQDDRLLSIALKDVLFYQ